MTLILRDFKPILDLNLYSEHMPEERIKGSKIGLDLSAGSTYLLGRLICKYIQYDVMFFLWNLPDVSMI